MNLPPSSLAEPNFRRRLLPALVARLIELTATKEPEPLEFDTGAKPWDDHAEDTPGAAIEPAKPPPPPKVFCTLQSSLPRPGPADSPAWLPRAISYSWHRN